jgi:hypothetical protein
VIKKILGVLAVLILALLGYASTRPDSFRVARTVTIQAPAAKIYPHLNDLKAQSEWSPWDKKDPAMKKTYGGPASGVGQTYEWDGNKDIGSGKLEITEAVADKKVAMKLDFTRPMEGHNVAMFELESKGAATDVTWSIQGPMPFLSKLFGIFCDMDKMIGKEFEAGLNDLKALSEKK